MYHKINALYNRNERGKLLIGEWCKPEFEYLKDAQWEFTEKVDGTNIRVMFDGQLRFGGRTESAQIPAHLVNRLNDIFDPSMGDLFPDPVTLYGEGFGAKIQKGGGQYGDVDFVLFDVKIGDWFLRREDVEDVASKLGIQCVPILGHGSLAVGERLVQNLKSKWGDFWAEGVVARPRVQLYNRMGERVIAKIKRRDYV